jgi:hypothetical protein
LNTESGLSAAEIMSTIKFGAGCIFKNNDNFSAFMNQDIDALLDQSRAQMNAEIMLDDFKVEQAPLQSIRFFEGTLYDKNKNANETLADQYVVNVNSSLIT